jgi:hypothetical protein
MDRQSLLRKWFGKARAGILRSMNSGVAASVSRLSLDGKIPCYIVVTPHLVHLAPMAAREHPAQFPPVLIANGLDEADVEWLATMCPGTPLIAVRGGIRRGSKSLLPHGVIIDLVADSSGGPFCLQDADCFILERDFWDKVSIDEDRDYAAGPFLKEDFGKGAYPETFFVCVNRNLMMAYRRLYRLSTNGGIPDSGQARRILEEAGFGEGVFPEPSKKAYDTMQQFWVVAASKGFRFRLLPGENRAVHHIGGTSYLHVKFEDLSSGEFWPLNSHYFHLRILEEPQYARFRGRFKELVQFHCDSQSLLRSFPAFSDGWRRRQTDALLLRLGSERRISTTISQLSTARPVP